jgi:hypothetical protein
MKAPLIQKYLFIFLFIMLTSCKKNAVNGTGADPIPSHRLQSEKDLDSLLQQIGEANIVLLGEASHGTAEYYDWRAAITKRLVLEKGFNMMAVEGEWADSYRVNQFIKGAPKDSAEAMNYYVNMIAGLPGCGATITLHPSLHGLTNITNQELQIIR